MDDPELDEARKEFEERGFCFFRSEDMTKVSITLPTDDRTLQVETIRALGDAEICQFLDVSAPASVTT